MSVSMMMVNNRFGKPMLCVEFLAVLYAAFKL